MELHALLLLLFLAIGTGAIEPSADGPLHLTRCPSGDLTLSVPDDLPVRSTLFSWDPALVSVRSSHAAYKLAVTKAMNRTASPSARAFFTEQPGRLEDVFSLAPDEPPRRAVLSRALPGPSGPDFVMGRFQLTCSARHRTQPLGFRSTVRGAMSRSSFRVHLRLVRPTTRPTVRSAEPSPDQSAAGGHLWRSPVSRFRAAAAGADALAALAGARLRIGLGPLLLAPVPRPLRVRLLEVSEPGRARLLAAADGSLPSLLLSLAPGDGPLSVGLEAVDAAGRSDVTTLLVSTGQLMPDPPRAWLGRWRRMSWWLPALISAAVLVALGLLVCACAWRRHLRAREAARVKPQFV